jgi:MFS family permease
VTSHLARIFKHSFGGLTKQVWLLAATQLINRCGTMVVFFLSVYLKDELHFGYREVGILMALFGIGSFVGTFVGGKLTDKLGHISVMRSSLLLGGLLFVTVSLFTSFWTLAFGLFLMSASAEAFRPANMAAIFHFSTKETYTRSVSLNRLAINLGFSIGPLVGGFLAKFNYSLIFIVDGVTMLCSALLVILLLKPGHGREEEKAKENIVQDSTRHSSPWKDKAFLFFLPLAMIYAMAFFQFFTTMPLYYKGVEHLSEEWIGVLMALNALLVAGVEMILIAQIEHKTSRYNLIALGYGLLLVSYLMLMVFTGYVSLLVITVIISFSEMLAMPFMNAFVNDRAHSKSRGQYAAYYGMVWSAAQVFTPILVTQILAIGSYFWVWTIYGVLISAATVGIKRLQSAVERNEELRVKN